jgi:DNA-directed RNA polymerase beta subunit
MQHVAAIDRRYWNFFLYKCIEHKGGFHTHHTDTMSKLYSEGIPTIINSFNTSRTIINNRHETPEDKSIKEININVKLSGAKIEKPMAPKDTVNMPRVQLPSDNYLKGTSYTGTFDLTVNVVSTAIHHDGKITVKEVTHAKEGGIELPIFKGSNRCNLENSTPEDNLIHNEHPLDRGGYFLINGNKWVPLSIENRKFNYAHQFANRHKNEQARTEYIAKPGDLFENSYQYKIRLLNNGQLNIELDHEPFKNKDIPFYTMFRLLGAVSDEEICDYIYYEQPDANGGYSELHDKIMDILDEAFNHGSNHFDDLENIHDRMAIINNIGYVINTTTKKASKSAKAVAKGKQAGKLDMNTLTHMNEVIYKFIDECFMCDNGRTPESRKHKMFVLGGVIFTHLLTHLLEIPSTNRDGIYNKNTLSAGPCFGKVIKRCVNSSIINPIVADLKKAYAGQSFSNVDLTRIIRQAVSKTKLTNEIVNTIKPAAEEKNASGKKIHTSRMSTELLNTKDKNHLYVICLLNTVMTPKTSSKKDKRADEIRAQNPASLGYYCCLHTSISGDTVGLQKNMACSQQLTGYLYNSGDIYNLIMKDDEMIETTTLDGKKSKVRLVILASSVTDARQVFIEDYCRIFLNGKLLAYTQFPERFKYKYRMIRRKHRDLIHPHVSITYEPYRYQIHFDTSVGRFIRPLLVVENNIDDLLYKGGTKTEADIKAFKHALANFKQDILMTPAEMEDLFRGKLTIQQLIDQGKIEMLAADEALDMHICSRPELLIAHGTDPLYQFTHLQMPASIYGISTLSQCFLPNNPATRAAYQAAQGKQAGGYQDIQNKFEKEIFAQYVITNPNVTTLTYNFTPPNGINAGLAIASHRSGNEEDSYEFSLAAAAAGAFDGAKLHVIDRILRDGESIADPQQHSIALNAQWNYEKARANKPYIIPVGSYVTKGTVLVCIVKVDLSSSTNKFTDESLVYDRKEPAIVDAVINNPTAVGMQYKIKVRFFRPLISMDKMSTRHGQKGVLGTGHDRADIMRNRWGMSPVIIANPHAFPTRMTIAQLIEMIVSKWASIKGMTVDATAFNSVDLEPILKELKDYGFNPDGTEVMFNDAGQRINTPIMYCPLFIQRLQKFAMDAEYVVKNPKRNSLTQQAAQGKVKNGGIRFGEMEFGVFIAQGVCSLIEEKTKKDSDDFTIHVCYKCGSICNYYRDRTGQVECPVCREQAAVHAFNTSYTSNLLFNEVNFLNMETLLYTKPYDKII